MSDPPADIVLLDGPDAPSEWPLALAESLLQDPTPWGIPLRRGAANRYQDAHRLATCVNMYHRLQAGTPWRNPIQDPALADHLARYTTQELLDGVFWGVRGERFSAGLTLEVEPRLRLAVAEVVRRIHSDTPPTFVTP
jgi:hypothetical protein